MQHQRFLKHGDMCRASNLDLNRCLLSESLMEFASLLRRCRCPLMSKTNNYSILRRKSPSSILRTWRYLIYPGVSRGMRKNIAVGRSSVLQLISQKKNLCNQPLGLSVGQLYHWESLCSPACYVSLAWVLSTSLSVATAAALPLIRRHCPHSLSQMNTHLHCDELSWGSPVPIGSIYSRGFNS